MKLCEKCGKPLIEDIGYLEECQDCPQKNFCPDISNLCKDCIKKTHEEKQTNSATLCVTCNNTINGEEYKKCLKCDMSDYCIIRKMFCKDCIELLYEDTKEMTKKILKINPFKRAKIALDIFQQMLIHGSILGLKEKFNELFNDPED